MLSAYKVYLDLKFGLGTVLIVISVLASDASFANDSASEVLRVRVQGKIVLGEADRYSMKFADDDTAMAEFQRNAVTLPRNTSVQLRMELLGRHSIPLILFVERV